MGNFRVTILPSNRTCFFLISLITVACVLMIFAVYWSRYRILFYDSPLGNVVNKPSSNSAIDWLNPSSLLADLEQIDTNYSVPVSYAVHAFYYAWYNTPEVGRAPNRARHWVHWNHPRLPHWISRYAAEFSTDPHSPPEDIASSYFPKLQPYASADEQVIRAHLRMLRFAGIGVLVLSWYPAGKADAAGEPMDHLVIRILNLAEKFGIKVSLHLEQYDGRTVESLRDDLLYARKQNYTSHAAYYRLPRRVGAKRNKQTAQEFPVFFVYDSYGISYADWRRLLLDDGDLTIRNRPEDAYLIGLMISVMDCSSFPTLGFDGGYTYYISRRTTQASTSTNWLLMSSVCKKNGIDFYPSIGPGYDDMSVRPWNGHSTVDREDGIQFEQMFKTLLKCTVSGMGITSFNEWHEGTQIEPAAISANNAYMDYGPFSEEFYLRLARMFVNRYANFQRLPRAFNVTYEYELDAINLVLNN